ncbi:MAG TPA: TIGR03564 family F420-dependent LLM class oxidoreductase [Acidimicrobiales bacterium]|nr:TIGR03564 family F420-dependent LLM class oxidoreductase [Acidimicrobiales bacterium]
MVTLGWAGGTGLGAVEDVRREARWAAAAGFDGFWVSQIFGVDPIVALAALGDGVPGLSELGTSVVPLYGRHPLALGAQALTAQSALGGRFTLGVGPSHAVFVEGVLGESYDRPYARTEEYLAALVPLLEGGGPLAVDAPPCPLLLAALGPRMLALAGRVAAGTTVGQCGPRTIAGHVVPRLTAAAEAAGRPEPRVMALVTVCVTDDPGAARDEARRHGELYARLPAYRAVLDREGVDGPADLLVAGSPDDVAAGLAAYVAAGATDLRVAAAGATPDDGARTREGLAALASARDWL